MTYYSDPHVTLHRLTLVRKSMGRKPGEELVRIAEAKVKGVI